MSSKAEKKLTAHLFVCTNRREKGSCCADKGASELRDRVKMLAKERGFRNVRVNAAGCLGHCEEGIVAVLYPEGQWFTNLSKDETSPLLQAIETALSHKKQ